MGTKAQRRVSADLETEESSALGVDGGNTWHRCPPLKANVQMLWRAGTLQGAQELLTRAVYVAWTRDRPESLSMKKITVLSYLMKGLANNLKSTPKILGDTCNCQVLFLLTSLGTMISCLLVSFHQTNTPHLYPENRGATAGFLPQVPHMGWATTTNSSDWGEGQGQKDYNAQCHGTTDLSREADIPRISSHFTCKATSLGHWQSKQSNCWCAIWDANVALCSLKPADGYFFQSLQPRTLKCLYDSVPIPV